MDSLEIIFLVCLIVSAISSALEASYLSFDRVIINRFENSNNFFNQIIFFFIKNIQFFLLSILLVNLIANTFSTWLFFVIFDRRFGDIYTLKSPIAEFTLVIGFTIFILIFVEFIPKQLGLLFGRYIAYVFTLFFIPFYFLFYPISVIYYFFFKRIIRKSKSFDSIDSEESSMDKKEFLEYVQLSSKTGALSRVEGMMIKNTVRHKDIPIRTIMTPRVKIKALDMDKLPSNIMKTVRQFKYKYVLFYRESLDNITGVLSKKKLFYNGVENISIENFNKHIDKPEFVLDNIPIIEAFEKIYDNHMDILFILDEFGGFQGIVTYHDIVNKVLGRINLSDIEKSGDIIYLGTRHYLIKGELSIVDFNDYFNSDILYKNIETMGGYLLEAMGRIPKKGDMYRDNYFKYTIKETTDRKIKEIILEKRKGSNNDKH